MSTAVTSNLLQMAKELQDSRRFEEADTLLQDALTKAPADKWIAHQYASCAAAGRNWPEALVRWQVVRERFPAHAAAYIGEADALANLFRFELGEALLEDATRRFPQDKWVFQAYGRMAMARKDWDSAIERFEQMRSAFPDHAAGFSTGGEALWKAGRLVEAETVLKQGTERFPDDLWNAHFYARLATALGNWSDAVERWAVIRQTFPNHADGFSAGGEALWKAGRLNEAEAVLEQGTKRFPGDLWNAHFYASLATAQNKWSDAVERWAVVRKKFPEHTSAYTKGADALRMDGRLQEGEDLINQALSLLPDDPLIIREKAKYCEIRLHWVDAFYYRSLWEAKQATHLDSLAPSAGEGGVAFVYWHQKSIPETQAPQLWTHIFEGRFQIVSDEDVREVIQARYPLFLDIYNRIRIPACRSDVARLLWLHHAGGLYFDAHCGINSLRKMAQLSLMLSTFEVVLFADTTVQRTANKFEVGNSLILARRGVDFTRNCVERVIKNLQTHFNLQKESAQFVPYNIWTLSGPLNLTREADFASIDGKVVSKSYGQTIKYLDPDRAANPFEKYRFYNYRKDGNHWSERQTHEPLFDLE